MLVFCGNNIFHIINDLFLSVQSKLLGIKIKRSNSPTVSKGFYESIKDLQADASYVIIPTGESYTKNDGVKVVNLREFLGEFKNGIV